MAISEEDLRGLSAVERDALLAVDDDDEDIARELGKGSDGNPAPAPAPATAPNVDVDDDDTPVSPAPAPAAADDKAKPTAPPAPAAAPTATPAAEVEDETVQQLQAPRVTPTDAAAQRTALRAEQSTALQRLMDGEISQDDYNKVSGGVQDKLDALVRAEAIDQARESFTRDTMMQEYSREVNAAQKAVRTAGLDLAANDGAIAKEFDRAVRMFATEAEARGLTDSPGNLAASKAALEEARDLILRRHGKATASALAASAPPPAPAARKPAPADRSQFPPTLAAVPAAADATITSEFSHLDGLQGAALERALAKLTPEQQDRYLG